MSALSKSLAAALGRDAYVAAQLFKRRTVDLQRLCLDLTALADVSEMGDVKRQALLVRRHLKVVRGRLSDALGDAYTELRAVEQPIPGPQADDDEKLRSTNRQRVQATVAALQRLDSPLSEIEEFIEGPEGELLIRSSSILLLGEWGTGKTHFVCDFAQQALDDGTPALVVLASELRSDIHPLDAIAEATRLAESGAELVRVLSAAAAGQNRRALVLIDAINESDREAWRRWLPCLLNDVAAAGHLGLVVSCRTPFDSSAVSDHARAKMVELHHPGFEDQEFDAQSEYFRHYGVPPLHVPLLSSEFSRPLFLRLLCASIKDLGKRSQRDKLRDLASGQKSLTYVLEYFVKHVGAEVEAAHGLSSKACWLIMKGEPRRGRLGLAGVLATHRREWLTPDEVVREVRAYTSIDLVAARSVVQSMHAAGLLIETSRYEDGMYSDIFMLPYQRFSDHGSAARSGDSFGHAA
ncbi:hypothetical protein EB75_04510 [Mycobacterium sp. ST-F2]|nr:hypothetical protein EB75_04510 [Mycobacterium sp. ST-F2]